ncbi:hypothetical protein BC834DRAFT_381431 [Gloeopeniophorella convolvens]|nr:hypothetical protein BC834DRAFT_381431 [Gloeopeniophorella convolvens]
MSSNRHTKRVDLLQGLPIRGWLVIGILHYTSIRFSRQISRCRCTGRAVTRDGLRKTNTHYISKFPPATSTASQNSRRARAQRRHEFNQCKLHCFWERDRRMRREDSSQRSFIQGRALESSRLCAHDRFEKVHIQPTVREQRYRGTTLHTPHGTA